jgi:hypothetical protein
MCRVVIHDYGRTNAMKILQHLRKAANQDTKLLLVEVVSRPPNLLSFNDLTDTRSLIMFVPWTTASYPAYQVPSCRQLPSLFLRILVKGELRRTS